VLAQELVGNGAKCGIPAENHEAQPDWRSREKDGYSPALRQMAQPSGQSFAKFLHKALQTTDMGMVGLVERRVEQHLNMPVDVVRVSKCIAHVGNLF
jgi:hypothetical protein